MFTAESRVRAPLLAWQPQRHSLFFSLEAREESPLQRKSTPVRRCPPPASLLYSSVCADYVTVSHYVLVHICTIATYCTENRLRHIQGRCNFVLHNQEFICGYIWRPVTMNVWTKLIIIYYFLLSPAFARLVLCHCTTTRSSVHGHRLSFVCANWVHASFKQTERGVSNWTHNKTKTSLTTLKGSVFSC